jgi:S-adenosylmethionine decarboxylase
VKSAAFRSAGSHLIVDLHGASALDDMALIERCLHRCIEKAGATLLHLYLHPFEPNGGVSGVALLAESHISIHTWPEYGYAAVDVFMCGKARPQVCIEVMREAFAPERCIVQEIPRGTIQ